MKECFKCGHHKPRSEFYAHPAMADGLLGKCKECTKRDTSTNRAANLERYQGYDRARADRPDRVALRQRVAEDRRADPIKRAIDEERGRRWRDRNFVKRRAHVMAGNAIRGGIIKRPGNCARCGGECVPHAHHEDYYRPLEVTWLCDDCHGQRHREINEEIRNGADLRCRGFDLARPEEAEAA